MGFHLKVLVVLFVLLQGCSDEGHSPVGEQRYEGQTWQLLDQTHGGDGSAYGIKECDQCHVIQRIHEDTPNIRSIVQEKGYESCTGCHGNNGTEAKRQCVMCHNSTDLPDHPLSLGINRHVFPLSAELDADQECIACHEVSNMDGVFDRQVDLTRFNDTNGEKQPYRNISEFCLRCHTDNPQSDVTHLLPTVDSENDNLLFMKTHYTYLDWHGYPDGYGTRVYSGLREDPTAEEGYEYQSLVECTDCHEMHGTHNASLFIASSKQGVSKLSDVFKQQDYEVNVHGDDYSQLCVMCHDMEMGVEDYDKDTGNGLSGVHETGRECRSCHQHGMSTQVGL